MLKQWARILGVLSCAMVLVACTSSKKHTGQNGTYDAEGAQSAGLGEQDGFDGSDQGAGKVGSGQKIYFAYDKYKIQPKYEPIITANVSYLLSHPEARVRIEGHTDEVGSREYNIALGEHRANSVKEALVQQGVASSQLSIVSYGKEYPVAACAQFQNAPCELNRRAVLVYSNLG